MKWERLPNGKWKPIKEFKDRADGKFEWDDPRYKARQKKALENLKGYCSICKNFFYYSNPCIHHLPDGYINEKKKAAYWKKFRHGEVDEATPKKEKGLY